ncbi:hypothetical protein [Sphingomonas sp. 1P08PE]|uniref:hypothetical protein n=1 Tax=Sphingomonas sp. 1P08PE TaxID=554122 RepID=UPI0039A2E15A
MMVEMEISSRRVFAGRPAAATLVVAPHGEAKTAKAVQAAIMPVLLAVDGRRHDLTLDTRATLLDALRRQLKLTFAKGKSA